MIPLLADWSYSNWFNQVDIIRNNEKVLMKTISVSLKNYLFDLAKKLKLAYQLLRTWYLKIWCYITWFCKVENLHGNKSSSLLQKSYKIDIIILNTIHAILTLEVELTERISRDAWFKARQKPWIRFLLEFII